MELCQGGSLDVVLKKMPALPLKEKLQICLDVARGLEYLHSRRIIHRDVAARNCLYDPDLKRVGRSPLDR
jgi:non-specific protein-tyrosine kinase